MCVWVCWWIEVGWGGGGGGCEGGIWNRNLWITQMCLHQHEGEGSTHGSNKSLTSGLWKPCPPSPVGHNNRTESLKASTETHDTVSDGMRQQHQCPVSLGKSPQKVLGLLRSLHTAVGAFLAESLLKYLLCVSHSICCCSKYLPASLKPTLIYTLFQSYKLFIF